uniref:Uncharacterized protein n=1 Tax=Lepeophtheirus salmonis TaxID=72036 RepID=A0A0K2UYW1_LEPSM
MDLLSHTSRFHHDHSEHDLTSDPSTHHSAIESLDDVESKIIPVSIVLMPVAQGMLIMGSHMKPEDCTFDLPEYLLVAGSVSLTLGIMGVVAKQILAYITTHLGPEDTIPRSAKNVLNVLKLISRLLMVTQIAILIAGVVMMVPNLWEWQSHDPKKSGYCEYGPVVFTSIYLCITWTFVFFGFFAILYIKIGFRKQEPRV